MNPDKHYFNYTPEQLNNFLKIAGSVCVGVLTLFLLVKTVSEIKKYDTIGESANGIQNIISVNGKSEMEVSPDITVFSWSVESEGKTIEQAQSKAAEINNKAIAFVKEKGIKEADIKTLSLNTYPKYESSYKNCPVYKGAAVSSGSAGSVVAPSIAPYPPCSGESVIVGYTTSMSVQVKVRDVNRDSKKTGELIAGLATIGVKASDPTSTIDDVDAYKRLVRDQAIIDARQQAEKLARALGVKLVRITSFSENGAGGYPYAAMDYMSARPAMVEKAAVAPDLPTGTNKIVSEVTITYQIK